MPIRLFLSPPPAADIFNSASGAAATDRDALLQSLDTLLRQALLEGRGARQELQLWLVETLAQLPLHPDGAARAFGRLLLGAQGQNVAQGRDSPQAGTEGHPDRPLLQQLLQLLCERMPQEVGELLADEVHIIKDFFAGHPRRAALFFGHFGMHGLSSFQGGARALAQYALVHRAEMWHLLVWEGKHPQAPVAVAQKLHYFAELDVPATVAALLAEEPAFWRSDELRAALAGGRLIALEPRYFVEALCDLLLRGGSSAKQLRQLVTTQLLRRCSWATLCQRLLHLLAPEQLLGFVNCLDRDAGGASSWPAELRLLLADVRWRSYDDLLLAAALLTHGRRVDALLGEDEREQQRAAAVEVGQQLAASPPTGHWRLRCRRAAQRSSDVRLFLALESAALHLAVHAALHANALPCAAPAVSGLVAGTGGTISRSPPDSATGAAQGLVSGDLATDEREVRLQRAAGDRRQYVQQWKQDRRSGKAAMKRRKRRKKSSKHRKRRRSSSDSSGEGSNGDGRISGLSGGESSLAGSDSEHSRQRTGTWVAHVADRLPHKCCGSELPHYLVGCAVKMWAAWLFSLRDSQDA